MHVNVVHNDVVFPVRALIDPASQVTFISRKLQRKLDLPTLSAPAATVVGVNGTVVQTRLKFVLFRGDLLIQRL